MNKKETEKFYKTTMMEEVDNIPLPKDFDKWLDAVVFKSHYRMFVKNIGTRKYLGSCQHCKNENIFLENVKPNQEIICPKCKHSCIVRNIKYSNIRHQDFVWLLNKCSIGFVMTLYEVIRSSIGIKYKYSYFPRERCFIQLEPNFEYRWFHVNGYGDWLNNRYTNMSYQLPYYNHTYTRNLKMINSLEKFRYAPIIEYCKYKEEYSNILSFLKIFDVFPGIEQIFKCNMMRLFDEILDRFDYLDSKKYFNLNGKTLKDILNLKRKSTVQFAIKNNANSGCLLDLYFLEDKNLSINIDNLLLASKFRLLNPVASKFFTIDSFKKYFLPLLSENSHIMYDYNDYFDNCLLLGRDMTDTKWLKPKDFKMAHDQAYKLVQSLTDKYLDSAAREFLQRFKKFAFKDDNYIVVIPKTANEIRKEGKDNANCVGGYIDRVAKQKSIICFIRHVKEPKKSFYTVEVNPVDYKIVQCRGYHNNPTSEEARVQAFARQWQKQVLDKFKEKVA